MFPTIDRRGFVRRYEASRVIYQVMNQPIEYRVLVKKKRH